LISSSKCRPIWRSVRSMKFLITEVRAFYISLLLSLSLSGPNFLVNTLYEIALFHVALKYKENS
jgi:hypothetical protein